MFPAGSNDSTKCKSGWPRANIETPDESDIICGRGGAANHTAANRRYRAMVNGHKPTYQKLARHKKTLMAEALVRKWKTENPPGRFLDKCDKTGLFFDIGFKAARRKTSQLLREKLPPEGILGEVVQMSLDDLSTSMSSLLGSSHNMTETNQELHEEFNPHPPPALAFEAHPAIVYKSPASTTNLECDLQDLGASIGSFSSLQIERGDSEELQDLGRCSFSEWIELGVRGNPDGSMLAPEMNTSPEDKNSTEIPTCTFTSTGNVDNATPHGMECNGNFKLFLGGSNIEVQDCNMDDSESASSVDLLASLSEGPVCSV